MAKLILHPETKTLSEIDERRMQEDFALSKKERMKKAFQLMRLSILFKETEIKLPLSKGLVLKYK